MKKEKHDFFTNIHNHIQVINDSKIFAGLMIIILNIATRFVSFKFSKSVESYVKNTFSHQLLVFAISWMGTRDIYIALGITTVFILCSEYLFNEESNFCILSEEFQDYHKTLNDEEENHKEVSEEDIMKARIVMEKAKKQNKLQDDELQGISMK
jgi:hypothetical protein